MLHHKIQMLSLMNQWTKLMGKESAVGKIIQSPRGNSDDVFTNMTVVGVVKDYVYGNVYDGKAAPLILFCKPPEDQYFLYVRLKAQSNAEQALSKIQEVMKKDNPAYPLEYKFVDDQFNEMFSNETQVSKVSGVFACIGDHHFMFGFIWFGNIHCRTQNKRNRYSQSVGCKCCRHHNIIIKRFFTVGCYCMRRCFSCCVVDHA